MRGPETERSHQLRIDSGFYNKYMSGSGLDIGYKGSLGDKAEPVLLTATGVDLDYPGYDGVTLPFEYESQDYVYASHVLEHIAWVNHETTIKEWFRVVKTGGHLVVIVPHMHLYEKKSRLPSRWNAGHKTFCTPSKLLKSIENVLVPNTYRLRHCVDNDRGFDYSIGPEQHSNGAYEIECVIQKINLPAWGIDES